jgi:hypothetical protein
MFQVWNISALTSNAPKVRQRWQEPKTSRDETGACNLARAYSADFYGHFAVQAPGGAVLAVWSDGRDVSRQNTGALPAQKWKAAAQAVLDRLA